MYYRIKNRLDVDALTDVICQNFSECLFERIQEIISVLDNAYGAGRGSSAMGGYLFLFPSCNDFEKLIEKIISFYGLKQDLYEFEETLTNENDLVWKERLYLLSSDDSLVLVFPEHKVGSD